MGIIAILIVVIMAFFTYKLWMTFIIHFGLPDLTFLQAFVFWGIIGLYLTLKHCIVGVTNLHFMLEFQKMQVRLINRMYHGGDVNGED